MDRSIRQQVAVALLALIGGAVLLVLATRLDEQPGSGQVLRSYVAGYLDDGHSIGQAMRLPLENLTGVQLWLVRPANPGGGTIFVTLQDSTTGEVFARPQIAVRDLPPDSPVAFDFPTVRVPSLDYGRASRVELVLTTTGVDRSSAVSVMAGPNRYSNGLLLKGDRQFPRVDLAFRPLYERRLLDRYLPVTRMAAGRQGMFGWPPLYALLLWLAVLACAWLLVLAYRLLPPSPPRA